MRWTVDLPYREDLPTLDHTRQQQAQWQTEEHAASTAPSQSTDRTFADFAALAADPGYGRAA